MSTTSSWEYTSDLIWMRITFIVEWCHSSKSGMLTLSHLRAHICVPSSISVFPYSQFTTIDCFLDFEGWYWLTSSYDGLELFMSWHDILDSPINAHSLTAVLGRARRYFNRKIRRGFPKGFQALYSTENCIDDPPRIGRSQVPVVNDAVCHMSYVTHRRLKAVLTGPQKLMLVTITIISVPFWLCLLLTKYPMNSYTTSSSTSLLTASTQSARIPTFLGSWTLWLHFAPHLTDSMPSQWISPPKLLGSRLKMKNRTNCATSLSIDL